MISPKLLESAHVLEANIRQFKAKGSRYFTGGSVSVEGSRLVIQYAYNAALKDEFKASLEGIKWEPERKVWSCDISERNIFVLAYTSRIADPYAPFDTDFSKVPLSKTRPTAYKHQHLMFAQAITTRRAIWAAEMGSGKSLAAIMAIEHEWFPGCGVYYVGPKAGVTSFSRELRKWNCKVPVDLMTYDELVRRMQEWKDGNKPPRYIIFDECSKLKNCTTKRWLAANHLATASRLEHENKSMIMALSGTPSPKDPCDWWAIAEVVCPGFLRERDQFWLRKRLAIQMEMSSAIGQKFYKTLAFRDETGRCDHCAKLTHTGNEDHAFEPCQNEVLGLFKRLRGLVQVFWKKDCLDLPPKTYSRIVCKPTLEMLRTAAAIKDLPLKAMTKLQLAMQLSDGFRYGETADGTKECAACSGTGRITGTDEDGNPIESDCSVCDGTGQVAKMVDSVSRVESPKDAVILEQLEAHEEVGRLVIWAGFTASIDKLQDMCLKEGWSVLRVDGRGQTVFNAPDVNLTRDDALSAMDKSNPFSKTFDGKLVVVANPSAGGMALTFTAAPTAVYYSNSFNGEARMQSEDRIHRAGLSKDDKVNIIDLICLGIDLYVLENLMNKKRLQNATLGEINEALSTSSTDRQ